MPDDLAYAAARLRAVGTTLPEVTEGTSYGTPSLRLAKKSLARVKDADTVVLMCPLEEKEMLLAAAPEIYFETDHYRGWPAILARIRIISDAELRNRLAAAWRMQATAKLAKAYPQV
jgi:hypothetical protein